LTLSRAHRGAKRWRRCAPPSSTPGPGARRMASGSATARRWPQGAWPHPSTRWCAHGAGRPSRGRGRHTGHSGYRRRGAKRSTAPWVLCASTGSLLGRSRRSSTRLHPQHLHALQSVRCHPFDCKGSPRNLALSNLMGVLWSQLYKPSMATRISLGKSDIVRPYHRTGGRDHR
jgi:hypothetical protein